MHDACSAGWCAGFGFLETDVSDVLGAVMCLTFSELLNPCSWLSLDRHML